MSNNENSAQQAESIQVHEFSRGFHNPHYSEKYQRWVSGGYSQEIASANYEVPEIIKSSVKRGEFRINSNFPPDSNKKDIALIARDFDEYSVLAVATGEYDDKGLRNVVAYRYFWLQKDRENIDGIATLLNWWLSQNKPCFHFPDEKSSIDYQAKICTLDDSWNQFQQNQDKFSSLIREITDLPYTSSIKIEQPIAVHLITRFFCNKYHQVPLAWAWNVTWLEPSTSTSLTLIHCVDDETCQKISRDVAEETTINDTVMTPQDINDIKTILRYIAENQNDRDITELFNLIEKFPIKSWEWNNIIFDDIHVTKTTARYWALSVILGYKSAVEWLEWLEQNPKYEKVSFALQQRLLDISDKSNNPQIRELFIDYIFQGISTLLVDYKQRNKKNKREIKRLLINSNSIWSRSFINYGQNIFYQLQYREKNKVDDEFYQELLYALERWEEKNKGKSTYNLSINPNLINIAELFKQVNNYDLSALLYQLSKGDVPSEIYKQVVQHIIPLAEKSNEQNKPFWKFVPYQLNKIPAHNLLALMAISGGLLLLLLPLIFGIFNSRNQESFTTNTDTGEFLISSNLEREMFRWERAITSKAKSESRQFINDELVKFEKEITKENYQYNLNDRRIKFLQDLVLPKIPDLKEITDNSSQADIKAVQQVLKILGIFKSPINGTYDEKTIEAVNKFQRGNNLKPVDGKVGEDTLKKMKSEFSKKQLPKQQLQATVNILKKIFQNQNDKQIENQIREVQKCKTDAFKYLDCVKKLSDKIQKPK